MCFNYIHEGYPSSRCCKWQGFCGGTHRGIKPDVLAHDEPQMRGFSASRHSKFRTFLGLGASRNSEWLSFQVACVETISTWKESDLNHAGAQAYGPVPTKKRALNAREPWTLIIRTSTSCQFSRQGMDAHMHTHTHTPTHASTHARMHARTHIHTHAHPHTRASTHNATHALPNRR